MPKRMALGWVETSSGTWHLLIETKPTGHRTYACGAKVEKGATLHRKPPRGARICKSCSLSPLRENVIRWSKGNFIRAYGHRVEIEVYGKQLALEGNITIKQARTLHERLGEFLDLIDRKTVTLNYVPDSLMMNPNTFHGMVNGENPTANVNLRKAMQNLPAIVFKGDPKTADQLAHSLTKRDCKVSVS